MNQSRSDEYDPEVLDAALAQLITEAQAARDHFILGNETQGRTHFTATVSAFFIAAHQVSLKNR